MAFSGKPDAPRKARPKISLKMQAIGFLSRREHSRQELRAKLLASLRKREREDAALESVSDAAAEALANALREVPSNGIDDAFAPRESPAAGLSPVRASRVARATAEPPASDGRRVVRDEPTPPATLLESLRPAGGAALPAGLGANSEAEVDVLLDWLTAHGYLSEPRFIESRIHARASRQGATRIRHELAQHGLALEPDQAAALRETEFARAQAIWQRKFGEVAGDLRERARQARFLAARGFAADVVRRIVGGEDEY